ncbi:glycosyltransferase family A protein [Prevotella sp. E13-17]|uniref:glycosyltransferase family 2 protein n=1 Tax=Prevotella sp. E13-17 TaxID=2913616 RepID=UPI00210615F5|nr:glycosyltransferase family A protein [Prevotella sp. E13-17]
MHSEQSHTPQHISPLVSFIIPTYNVPTYMIKDCLHSILSLSLRPAEREIILVDDGSQKCVIDELDDAKEDIIYIRQRNQGQSAARNMGLKMATGKYVQFVDSDDRLITPVYEHCLDLIRFKQPEMVVFDYTNKEKQQVLFKDHDERTGIDYMTNCNIHGTVCDYIFSRDIIGGVRFVEGIIHEDENFTPRLLLKAKRVVVTDAKAYLYNTRTDSTTNKRTPEAIAKRLDNKLYVIEGLRKLALQSPTDERVALSRRVAQLTMDYIYQIIIETKSRTELDTRLEALKQKQLFPLPERDYTNKYKWFRRMTNSEIGLTVLLHTLPLMSRER